MRPLRSRIREGVPPLAEERIVIDDTVGVPDSADVDDTHDGYDEAEIEDDYRASPPVETRNRPLRRFAGLFAWCAGFLILSFFAAAPIVLFLTRGPPVRSSDGAVTATPERPVQGATRVPGQPQTAERSGSAEGGARAGREPLGSTSVEAAREELRRTFAGSTAWRPDAVSLPAPPLANSEARIVTNVLDLFAGPALTQAVLHEPANLVEQRSAAAANSASAAPVPGERYLAATLPPERPAAAAASALQTAVLVAPPRAAALNGGILSSEVAILAVAAGDAEASKPAPAGFSAIAGEPASTVRAAAPVVAPMLATSDPRAPDRPAIVAPDPLASAVAPAMQTAVLVAAPRATALGGGGLPSGITTLAAAAVASETAKPAPAIFTAVAGDPAPTIRAAAFVLTPATPPPPPPASETASFSLTAVEAEAASGANRILSPVPRQRDATDATEAGVSRLAQAVYSAPLSAVTPVGLRAMSGSLNQAGIAVPGSAARPFSSETASAVGEGLGARRGVSTPALPLGAPFMPALVPAVLRVVAASLRAPEDLSALTFVAVAGRPSAGIAKAASLSAALGLPSAHIAPEPIRAEITAGRSIASAPTTTPSRSVEVTANPAAKALVPNTKEGTAPMGAVQIANLEAAAIPEESSAAIQGIPLPEGADAIDMRPARLPRPRPTGVAALPPAVESEPPGRAARPDPAAAQPSPEPEPAPAQSQARFPAPAPEPSPAPAPQAAPAPELPAALLPTRPPR